MLGPHIWGDLIGPSDQGVMAPAVEMGPTTVLPELQRVRASKCHVLPCPMGSPLS